jgi:hypothetical protein
MNDIRQLLMQEADRIHPVTDIEDVYRRADRRRRQARNRRLAGSAIGAILLAGLAASTANRSTASNVRTNAEVTEASLGGMAIDGAKTNDSYHASTLERNDHDPSPSVATALVVRGRRGSIRSRTAVITYRPNVFVANQEPAHVGSTTGVVEFTVARPNGSLVVRAIDLSSPEVEGLATATEVVDGRPLIRIPASLSDFSIVASGTSRPSTIREARYGCSDLGEVDTQGLCYAALTFSPGLQDALFAAGFQPGPDVAGQPSVVSALGGSGLLAWEPRPGVIAYIGYSANPLVSDPDTVNSLARLAGRARFLSPAEWAATKPSKGNQTNEWTEVSVPSTAPDRSIPTRDYHG